MSAAALAAVQLELTTWAAELESLSNSAGVKDRQRVERLVTDIYRACMIIDSGCLDNSGGSTGATLAAKPQLSSLTSGASWIMGSDVLCVSVTWQNADASNPVTIDTDLGAEVMGSGGTEQGSLNFSGDGKILSGSLRVTASGSAKAYIAYTVQEAS